MVGPALCLAAAVARAWSSSEGATPTGFRIFRSVGFTLGHLSMSAPVVCERCTVAVSVRQSQGSSSCSTLPLICTRTKPGCTSAWISDVSSYFETPTSTMHAWSVSSSLNL